MKISSDPLNVRYSAPCTDTARVTSVGDFVSKRIADQGAANGAVEEARGVALAAADMMGQLVEILMKKGVLDRLDLAELTSYLEHRLEIVP